MKTHPPPWNYESSFGADPKSCKRAILRVRNSRFHPGAAFVRENHRQLQARIGDLKGVLDDLQDNEVLSENEKELVEQAKTRQSKTNALLSMVEKKGDRALELLFRSLSERDPYLVSYLRQQSL